MHGRARTLLAGVIVLASACLGGAGQEPQRVSVADLNTKFVLIGQLDQRFGTFMTVEGVAAREWMGTGWPVVVETVDGKQLAKPVTIGITHAPKMTQGTRYVIRGYENCGMVGTPVDPKEKADASMVQQPLAFQIWFEATKVQEPADMKQGVK